MHHTWLQQKRKLSELGDRSKSLREGTFDIPASTILETSLGKIAFPTSSYFGKSRIGPFKQQILHRMHGSCLDELQLLSYLSLQWKKNVGKSVLYHKPPGCSACCHQQRGTESEMCRMVLERERVWEGQTL